MLTTDKPRLSWRSLLTQTVLAIYGYTFLEWLFFATKPSFMDSLSLASKLELFLLTGLVLAAFVLPCLAVLRLLGWIPGPWKKWRVFLFLGALLPALLAAAASLLLIDNFTYTLFKFGIVTSQGIVRGVYAVLAVVLLAVWYRQVLLNLKTLPRAAGVKTARSRPTRWRNVPFGLALALIAVSLPVGFIRVATAAGPAKGGGALLQHLPNIVLLGADGMDASNLSLYGYGRKTTPRLDELAPTGLLAENNFSNADHTTGSVFSMLTGKYPAATRLLYSPNILQGADAYEHLPGILQRAGYTTVQITFPYYVDAYDVNMQEGFDEVNSRSLDQGELFQLARRIHFEDVGYFLPRLSERIFDRLEHIFYLRNMPDPYRDVIQPVDPNNIYKMSDTERMEKLGLMLLKTDRPLFVNVHLMGTHGYKFYPRQRVFSAGEDQTQDWMTDFIDDATLDFDAYVGELADTLSRAGLLDNTILIIYSDHVDRWRINGRIPLFIRFPHGDYAGRIRNNTQNLDIAPTLLDYLGMETPAWMSGQSLLEGEPARMRPIISASVVGVECHSPDWWCVIDPTLSRPPFYQFGFLQVVVCQKMFILNLSNHQWSEEDVAGYTNPCKTSDLPTRAQAQKIMLSHLRSNGFNVSSLEQS
jgi:hypothetical protein